MLPLLLALGIFTLVIDTHPPKIIPYFQNNTILPSSILRFNISDDTGLKACYYYLNTVKEAFNCKEIKLDSGCYNITVEAIDLVGRMATDTFHVCIDSEPPKIISYGFYPSNNSLPVNNYTFWIEAEDDFRITKIYAIVNGKIFYGNRISPDNINVGRNIITWVICDAVRCINKTLVYYVRYNPQVLLLEVPEEVFLGECFNITYKTNLERVNITIDNETFNVVGSGSIRYCPKHPGKLIIRILNESKIVRVINTVNSTFWIEGFDRDYHLKVEFKRKVLYDKKDVKHKFMLPEEAKIVVSTDEFSIVFLSPELKDKLILYYKLRSTNDSIIYNFSADFSFEEAIVYLYTPFDFFEVFVCKNYGDSCISGWEKVKYVKQGKYIVIKVPRLYAFKIEKRECEIKIFYENPIYGTPQSTIKTIVYIKTNNFCPKYNLKVNYSCIIRNIGKNSYELVFKIPEHKIVLNVSYGPRWVLITVIPREFGKVIIQPLQDTIYAVANETFVNFRVNNMLSKELTLNISSDLGEWEFLIKPKESKIIKIKVPTIEGTHIFYFRFLNESRIFKIKIINATRYISLNITLLKKEPPYLIKIEMSSKIPIKTKICYGIRNEYEKCENITLTGYTYMVRSVIPKTSGLKEIYARIGDRITKVYIMYNKIGIKMTDLLPYIALAVISLIVTKLIVK